MVDRICRLGVRWVVKGLLNKNYQLGLDSNLHAGVWVSLQSCFEQESQDRWFEIRFTSLVGDWIAGSALDRIGSFSSKSHS